MFVPAPKLCIFFFLFFFLIDITVRITSTSLWVGLFLKLLFISITKLLQDSSVIRYRGSDYWWVKWLVFTKRNMVSWCHSFIWMNTRVLDDSRCYFAFDWIIESWLIYINFRTLFCMQQSCSIWFKFQKPETIITKPQHLIKNHSLPRSFYFNLGFFRVFQNA